MGTPEFAVPVLKGLIDNYEVVLVVTQPDKIVGRKKELTSSPVKKLATQNNIPVFQPTKIRTDYEVVINTKADIIITCAFGQIIPKEILDYPRLGCINVHASLLPKLRGGAPIHKAIIDGYEKTGITIMYMDQNMDTGDIISQREYTISDTDNVGLLHELLSKIGCELLLETIPNIIEGKNERIKQNDEEATYAYNIKREDEHLDFNNKALAIYNKIRGLNPWPLANILINDEEIKVLDAYYELNSNKKEFGFINEIRSDAIGISSNDGTVYLTKIKPFGKKEMPVKDYLNGIDKNKLIGISVK